MSEQRPLVELTRAGGQPPSDDEAMRIFEDGRFEARRTVGGARIGSFAGQLPEAEMASLREAAAALAGAEDLSLPTPLDGATETLRVASGGSARLGSGDQPEGPWRGLVEEARRLLERTVVASPMAAIELRATTSSASLAHVGEHRLEVDTTSIALRAVRFDEQGLVQGRWRGATAAPSLEDAPAARVGPSWTEVAPGWTLSLPFDHGLELASQDRLQVWVMLELRDETGARSGRLFAAISGGAASD